MSAALAFFNLLSKMHHSLFTISITLSLLLKLHAQIITTFAGQVESTITFNSPVAVALDPSGGVYVSDADSNCVRHISPTGVISAFAGQGTAGYAGDGGRPVEALFAKPSSVAYDGAASIIIADTGNGVLRRVDAAAGKVSTVPGGPPAGAPSGVSVLAPTGDFLVVHSLAHVVQRVTSKTYDVQPYAGVLGSSGFAGDGFAATSALLSSPAGAISDGKGGALIADFGNFCVRAVSSTGIITTGGLTIGGYCHDYWRGDYHRR
jgi:hypothetical protein